jgi:hypothetical protein
MALHYVTCDLWIIQCMTICNDNLDLVSRTFGTLIYVLEYFDNKLLKYPKIT